MARSKKVKCTPEIMRKCKYGERFNNNEMFCNYSGITKHCRLPKCTPDKCTCFEEGQKRDYHWMQINKVDRYVDFRGLY